MSFIKVVCGGCFGGAWFVEGAVAEHREEHARAVPGEAEEILDAGLPLIPPYVAPAVRLAAGELDRL